MSRALAGTGNGLFNVRWKSLPRFTKFVSNQVKNTLELGSSLFGAEVAAAFGLPYAFASHFAPALMMPAIELYRAGFRQTGALDRPYVMLGLNVFAADSDAEARLLWSSLVQAFANLRRRRPGPLPPPDADFESQLSPLERGLLEEMLSCTVVGSPRTVERGLEAFISRTQADEVIVASAIYDHPARLRSYELVAQARDRLGPFAPPPL